MKTPFGPHIALLLLAALCLTPGPAPGEEGEDTLGLYSDWREQPVSAGRAPKPLSHTPENVTVITSREIESLNAHTLADVLAAVPGIQLENLAGPGGVAHTNIQGSKFNHVLVLLDGVPLNNVSDNFPDVGLVPARIIERIEIVKGAASSAWGQALGGVINVITRFPEQGRPLAGTASASLGERTTVDSGAELGGSSGRVGYYLSGGFLGSDGLLPNTRISANNAHARLSYDLPGRGRLSATFNHTRAGRGQFASQRVNFRADDAVRYLNATLGYRTPLGEKLDLELTARHTARRIGVSAAFLDSGIPVRKADTREAATGAGIKLVRRSADNLLVIGGDYEHAEFTSNDALRQVDLLDRTVDRWGVYLNDTLTLGPLAISPGARFDRTQSGGDQFSPSLGLTWQMAESTLLRGYTARGFSLPELTLERRAEKVWSSQVGIETAIVPYLWLRETLFRNETWDVTAVDPRSGKRLLESRIALGSETEIRTTPFWNTSLGVGYTFTDTTRAGDGSQVKGVPRHTLQLALRYDDHRLLRALMTGRHVWWNADPADSGRYYGLIWDLHLGATLFKRESGSLELFLSGRNLFNNSQFTNSFFPNPGRWFEGGLKVRF